MAKKRLIAALALVGLALLLVVQNRGEVPVHFLFWDIGISKSLLVLLVFAAGAAAGAFWASRYRLVRK